VEELRKSSYVIIDSSDNIIYDFDEVVRFVIRSYFSAMYVAASWIAGDAIQQKSPHLLKDSIVFHQKEIDRITYHLLANSIDINKSIEEKLRGYISNLLCTTNELRHQLKDFPDVLPNESDVSKWMETFGLNKTIRKTIDYYFDRFNKSLPIDSLDEVSNYVKPKSGYHINSRYISQALPLIFFDTICMFLSDNARVWLSVEMKSMVSDLIANMFAEIHYIKEDLQYVENEISMSHNNRNKIEIACRYPQVSCDVIRLMEDFYKNVFAESESKNYFFYEGDIYDERYNLLKEKYYRQIGINESLQSFIAKRMTKERNNQCGVNPPVQLPDVLNTKEAHELWNKAKQANWVNDNFQPLVSWPKAAMIASGIGVRLGIKDSEKWKYFAVLWNYDYLSSAMVSAQKSDYYGDFCKEINVFFGLS